MNRIERLLAELAPDGVPHLPLGEMGAWRGGGTPSKARRDFWTNGTIPWISPKDMRSRVLTDAADHITEAALQGSATSLVPQDAIVMVVRSSILDRTFPTARLGVSAALNQDMKAIIPRRNVLPEYLGHLLSSRGSAILRATSKTGGSVTSIDFNRLLKYRIPVPPLRVQREVVGILDKFTELEAELEAKLGAELEARRQQFDFYRDQLLSFERERERESQMGRSK